MFIFEKQKLWMFFCKLIIFLSVALTLKDPYIDRPLPHIIGTEEWHKKWHVGLRESPSDSENEASSEKFSDTDSETDLPISNRTTATVTTTTTTAQVENKIIWSVYFLCLFFHC